jgi:2-C-methyl-D-erythritol 4-phosphate cytidylyltransferase
VSEWRLKEKFGNIHPSRKYIIIADGRRPFMNLKLIAAILVIGAVPVCAQAQNPSAAKLTRADAQKVVKIISSDKAKTRTFCDIGKLGEQIEEANEKRDRKTADELSQKMKELEKKLGPEYVTLMDGLQDIDPESDDGVDIQAALAALDKSCAKE